ncbi:MAG TPA: transposase [Rhodothermales bacterium]|nr:transposase [Rhodothermales bacterium]
MLRYVVLGQDGDASQAEAPLALYGAEAVAAVLADRGYDSGALVAYIDDSGAEAVIPSCKHAKQPRQTDRELYKERNKVERFFNQVKHSPPDSHALREDRA